MTGYDFHPEAEIDLDEIWEFIAADNVAAADRVMAAFVMLLKAWCHSQIRDTYEPI